MIKKVAMLFCFVSDSDVDMSPVKQRTAGTIQQTRTPVGTTQANVGQAASTHHKAVKKKILQESQTKKVTHTKSLTTQNKLHAKVKPSSQKVLSSRSNDHSIETSSGSVLKGVTVKDRVENQGVIKEQSRLSAKQRLHAQTTANESETRLSAKQRLQIKGGGNHGNKPSVKERLQLSGSPLRPSVKDRLNIQV